MKVKSLFYNKNAEELVTNSIRLALNYREDILAGVILAAYNVKLDESFVNFAVASQCFTFLQ